MQYLNCGRGLQWRGYGIQTFFGVSLIIFELHIDAQDLIVIFETNAFDHLKCNLALGAEVLAAYSKMSVLLFIAHTL